MENVLSYKSQFGKTDRYDWFCGPGHTLHMTLICERCVMLSDEVRRVSFMLVFSLEI